MTYRKNPTAENILFTFKNNVLSYRCGMGKTYGMAVSLMIY